MSWAVLGTSLNPQRVMEGHDTGGGHQGGPAAAPLSTQRTPGKSTCRSCSSAKRYCDKRHPCTRCLTLGITCIMDGTTRGRPPCKGRRDGASRGCGGADGGGGGAGGGNIESPVKAEVEAGSGRRPHEAQEVPSRHAPPPVGLGPPPSNNQLHPGAPSTAPVVLSSAAPPPPPAPQPSSFPPGVPWSGGMTRHTLHPSPMPQPPQQISAAVTSSSTPIGALLAAVAAHLPATAPQDAWRPIMSSYHHHDHYHHHHHHVYNHPHQQQQWPVPGGQQQGGDGGGFPSSHGHYGHSIASPSYPSSSSSSSSAPAAGAIQRPIDGPDPFEIIDELCNQAHHNLRLADSLDYKAATFLVRGGEFIFSIMGAYHLRPRWLKVLGAVLAQVGGGDQPLLQKRPRPPALTPSVEWVQEMFSVPGAASIAFLMGQPGARVQHAVQCNDLMRQLYFSEGEVVECCRQLRLIVPFALTLLFDRQSIENFFSIFTRTTSTGVEGTGGTCYVRLRNRRGNFTPCVATIRAYWEVESLGCFISVGFLPINPVVGGGASAITTTSAMHPSTRRRHHHSEPPHQQQQEAVMRGGAQNRPAHHAGPARASAPSPQPMLNHEELALLMEATSDV